MPAGNQPVRPQGVAGDCNSLAETHAWFDSRVAHHSQAIDLKYFYVKLIPKLLLSLGPLPKLDPDVHLKHRQRCDVLYCDVGRFDCRACNIQIN